MKGIVLICILALTSLMFGQETPASKDDKNTFRAVGVTPHSVTLSWGGTVNACVQNTNIHRATTQGGEIPVGQPGSNLAVVPIATKTYVDTTVVAGTTYYYTASFWGINCGGTLHESAMSNEVKAVVPADVPTCTLPSTIINGVCTPPPAPPTGLTAVPQ